MVRRLAGPEDPFAAVGRTERGLVGLAAAYSGSEGLVASAADFAADHWDILNYACRLGGAGGTRLAVAAAQVVWVVPSACSQTPSPTWCWLFPGVSAVAVRPS